MRRDGKSGRRAGTPNRFTTVKQAFLNALEKQGYEDLFIKICETRNGKIAFMNCVARLLPTTETVHHDHDLSNLTEEQLRAIVESAVGNKKE